MERDLLPRRQQGPERERERERDRDRQTDRQTDRKTDRHTVTDGDVAAWNTPSCTSTHTPPHHTVLSTTHQPRHQNHPDSVTQTRSRHSCRQRDDDKSVIGVSPAERLCRLQAENQPHSGLRRPLLISAFRVDNEIIGRPAD